MQREKTQKWTTYSDLFGLSWTGENKTSDRWTLSLVQILVSLQFTLGKSVWFLLILWGLYGSAFPIVFTICGDLCNCNYLHHLHFEQESIPVGCLPLACQPYSMVSQVSSPGVGRWVLLEISCLGVGTHPLDIPSPTLDIPTPGIPTPNILTPWTYPAPPLEDTCENITFPQLRLWVIITSHPDRPMDRIQIENIQQICFRF